MRKRLAWRLYRLALRMNRDLYLHMEPAMSLWVQHIIEVSVRDGLVAQADALVAHYREHVRDIAQRN